MAGRPANFNHLARPYRWLEYLTFGPYLEHCRNHFLNQLGHHRRALILGDGDGRFTAKLLAANPEITGDAVDSSATMLHLLTERVSRLGQTARQRLNVVPTDALAFTPEGPTPELPPYDLVVTHFFLDCFTEEELPILLAHIVPHLTPGAVWLVSEFAIPKSQPAAAVSKLIIATLYRAFQTLTGLKAHTLADYSAQLRKYGFSLHKQALFLGGLLVAELWSLEQGNHPAPSALTPLEGVNAMPTIIEFPGFRTFSASSFPGPIPEPDPAPDPDPVPIPGPGSSGIDPGFPVEPIPAPAPIT